MIPKLSKIIVKNLNNKYMSDSEVDALAFASITNRITDPNVLNELYKFQAPENQITFSSPQEKENQLNNILKYTTLKRACCLGVDKVKVRIPKPEGAVYDPNSYTDQTAQKYGYYDKYITIPKSLCDTYVPGYNKNTSDGLNRCEDFYSVYCGNMIQEYNAQNNGNFNAQEFSEYKPECICYSPTPEFLKDYPPQPSKCLYSSCNPGNQGVWIDKLSRGFGDCSGLTICNANIDISQVESGRDTSILNQIQQNCGPGKNPFNNTRPTTGGGTIGPTPTPTPTPTPIPTPTPTPTTTPTPMPIDLRSFSLTSITKGTPQAFGISAVLCCCLLLTLLFAAAILLSKQNQQYV